MVISRSIALCWACFRKICACADLAYKQRYDAINRKMPEWFKILKYEIPKRRYNEKAKES